MDKNEDLIENVGQLIDTVENYLTLQNNHIMPVKMRADAALSGISDIRKKLLDIYADIGGEYDFDSPVSKSFDSE